MSDAILYFFRELAVHGSLVRNLFPLNASDLEFSLDTRATDNFSCNWVFHSSKSVKATTDLDYFRNMQK